jgi:hypothetical protein
MTHVARILLCWALTFGGVLLLPATAVALPPVFRPVPNINGLDYIWLQRAYYRYYEVANSAAQPAPPPGTRYEVTERRYVTGIGPDFQSRTILIETVTAVPPRAPVARTVRYGANR